MRRTLAILLLTMLLLACRERDKPNTPENRFPTVPTNLIPANGTTNLDTALTLRWRCSDPDGDMLRYDVQFDTVSPPAVTVTTRVADTAFFVSQLQRNRTYYWRILANDGNHAAVASEIAQFTTALRYNHPPNAPYNPNPNDLATVPDTVVNLRWRGRDSDNDTLRYDVLLDTVAPPVARIATAIRDTFFTQHMLQRNRMYYWQVIAYDGNNSGVAGAVWRFTTNLPVNRPPSQPSLPVPADSAMNVDSQVTLQWRCTDPDFDTLRYTLYLDTVTPPVRILAAALPWSSYQSGTLQRNRQYFWQVRVDDNRNPTVTGPIWRFSTTPYFPGEVKYFPLGTSGDSIAMCWIPPGSFLMGATWNEASSDSSEYPQHIVTFARGFWMGKYEVMQKQWRAVMGSNPSHFIGDSLPVEQVSSDNVKWSFLTTLSNSFRLPSEAEWEYACRAGTTTRYYWGNDPDSSQIGNYCWYELNSGQQPYIVGTKLPNAWGLYDMVGNVWEWCEDRWHENYVGAPSDGSAWDTGTLAGRILRGGSWHSFTPSCRSARRNWFMAGNLAQNLGFRLVRNP